MFDCDCDCVCERADSSQRTGATMSHVLQQLAALAHESSPMPLPRFEPGPTMAARAPPAAGGNLSMARNVPAASRRGRGAGRVLASAPPMMCRVLPSCLSVLYLIMQHIF